MSSIIQLRRGTAAAWTLANPILAGGEIGYETDTNKAKIGNGIDNWTTLVYLDFAGDRTYTQSFTSATTVTVTHNLLKKPSVTVWDSSGDEIECDVHHNSSNTLTLTFSAAFTGTVTCN